MNSLFTEKNKFACYLLFGIVVVIHNSCGFIVDSFSMIIKNCIQVFSQIIFCILRNYILCSVNVAFLVL